MRKDLNVLSEVAIFLAGALAVGLVTGRRKDKPPPTAQPAATTPPPGDGPGLAELRKSVAKLEARMASQEAASAKRFTEMEARLSEAPSTQQIVSAMEQVLSKTMSSLDDRLTTQAHSIEALKTTVSQTDSLLERVMELLDSLQAYGEPLELPEETRRTPV